jgi:hypothetical protein
VVVRAICLVNLYQHRKRWSRPGGVVFSGAGNGSPEIQNNLIKQTSCGDFEHNFEKNRFRTLSCLEMMGCAEAP